MDSARLAEYRAFLARKVAVAPSLGFDDVTEDEVNPILKSHQRVAVAWAVKGGRRALFESFGLGKSVQQLEILRLILKRAPGRGLIVCPLGVRAEFIRDAAMLGTPVRFIRRIEEADDAGIYLTNYETIRDGKIDPQAFVVASLDEASVLRGFGGTKTFREFMRLFAGDAGKGRGASEVSGIQRGRTGGGVPYRFVATATPSPNEYIELLAYSAYLDVLDVSAAKTRFFKRDSTKADHLTIHPHKEHEFWMWVSSWALFLNRPSDLGFDDTGYDLPPLEVHWHEISTDHSTAGAEKDGQARLFKNAALGVSDAAREKRDTLPDRIAKMLEIRAEEPDEHRIIWHDLEDERRAVEAAIPGVVSVYGTQDLEERERFVAAFANGDVAELAGKPVMLGSGTNLQRHCARAIYLGIGWKFNDFIQSTARLRRFLQNRSVRIDLIYSEAEREVRRALETKWKAHEHMVEKMTAIIREHGLAENWIATAARGRAMGVQRAEVLGDRFRLVNADSIEETMTMPENSVDLVVTSIPFSTQYEYTPSFNDLGHTSSDDEFFEHLGFLTPELERVLKPGRIAAVHVKDRIVPGGLTGFGFQTVSPFSDATIVHFRKSGFAFLGRKTIVTDVVRENNQTYRLGWTEQCKDGTRMGYGMPEYILLFRKIQTDRTQGYADTPVVKSKGKYSRSRWQVDAHGFTRSSGDRLISPEEIVSLAHNAMFQRFRDFYLANVYDFEHHVKLCEALEEKNLLPTTFMLLQPPSWHPDVWTDVARMRTMNMLQAQRGKESHLCPLQFDIVNRLIVDHSMEGETVYDPFSGLGTVALCALKLGRRGIGVELNSRYFADSVGYCQAAARDVKAPTLFDLADLEIKPVEAAS